MISFKKKAKAKAKVVPAPKKVSGDPFDDIRARVAHYKQMMIEAESPERRAQIEPTYLSYKKRLEEAEASLENK